MAAQAREWRPEDPPYPSLRAFREEDATIFFGRDEEIAEGVELLNRVRHAADTPADMCLTTIGATSDGSAPARPCGNEPFEVLSGRESHVLKLLGQGRSNNEIARALGVAPETIKYHLKSVFAKLDVRNRAQAAVKTKSFGLI